MLAFLLNILISNVCNRIKNLEESSYADASHFQLKLILCYTFFSLSNVLSNIMLLIAIVK